MLTSFSAWGKAGVDFVAADMPSASWLMVGIMTMVADEERRIISRRTKEALAAKARGKTLSGNQGNLPVIGYKGRATSLAARQAKAQGRAADSVPIIEELRAAGAITLQQTAERLNAKGIKTAHGGEGRSEQVLEHVTK